MSTGHITLHHFTSKARVIEIQSAGLTKGFVPIHPTKRDPRLKINPGFQWLTSSGDWTQRWASMERITEDRTEVRFEIRVPMGQVQNLLRWIDIQEAFGWYGSAAENFNFGNEGADWLLWQGNLPPELIVNTEERPKHGK